MIFVWKHARGIEGLIDSRIEFRGLRLWIVGDC